MIKTLSIPADMQLFLNENPDLSPSKMLQSKIIEIQENRKLNFPEIRRLTNQVKLLQHKLWEADDNVEFLKKQIAKLKNKPVPLDDGKNDKFIS